MYSFKPQPLSNQIGKIKTPSFSVIPPQQNEQSDVSRLQKDLTNTNVNSDEADITIAKEHEKPDKSDPVGVLTGRRYPIIQINEHTFLSSEIEYLKVSINDMVPSVTFKCNVLLTNLLKTDMPKDGDLLSVYLRSEHDFYKPINIDFLIDEVITSKYNSFSNDKYQFFITGKLFVPNFYTQGIIKAYPNQTSFDVIKNVAMEFKLGFATNEESSSSGETFNDKQVWYHAGESTQDFIKNVATHSWRDELSFFDVWVDQFYNLSFVNINKMLGTTLQDDGLMDIALAVTSSTKKLADHTYNEGKREDDEENYYKTYRLFTNLEQARTTNMFIDSYSVDNQSSRISNENGHVLALTYNINNQALQESGQSMISIPIEPIYNLDKISNHIILRGRSSDGFHNELSGYDFANNNAETILQRVWGGDVQSMADGDEEKPDMRERFGNSHKNYTRAFYHNKINNDELKKLTLNLTLPGLNTAVLRGEKIAVLNVENSLANGYLNNSTNKVKEGDIDEVANSFQLIDAFYSGWFIITGIEYIFDRSYNPTEVLEKGSEDMLSYHTVLKCSRREWVPPEAIASVCFDKDGNLINASNVGKNEVSESEAMQHYKDKANNSLFNSSVYSGGSIENPYNDIISTISTNDYSNMGNYKVLTTKEQKENSNKIMNFLINRMGLTKEQAAGIVGNIAQESSFNPSIKNSSNHVGLFQWGGARREGLMKFAQSQGKKWDDLQVQLDYLEYELNTTEKNAYNALKNTKTATEAAYVFSEKFERAGSGAMNEKRQKYALEALRNFDELA